MRAVGDRRALRWRKPMKALILATAAALALGFGGAGAANAWSGHSGSAMGPSSRTMASSGTSSMRTATRAVSHRRGMAKEAQRMLRRDGLYHGHVDGIVGPRTRQALARYQKGNGLRVTASLDRATMASLMGHGTTGAGSSAMHSRMTTGQTGTASPMPSETGTHNQTTGTGSIPPSGTATGTNSGTTK